MSFKETLEKNIVLWFLGTLLVGFLAGISTYEGIMRISGRQAISKDVWSNAKQNIDILKKKERFLSLFLRYEQAKEFEEKAFAREALDEYIEKFIDESDRFESTIGVGKGAGKQTTINFPDGTHWIVPPDFRSAKKK